MSTEHQQDLQEFIDLRARIKELEAELERWKQMKWTSVKDRLPSNRQEILTYWPERNQIQVQRYYLQYGADGPWWMFGWENHLLSNGDITHWMPLPDIPEEVNDVESLL